MPNKESQEPKVQQEKPKMREITIETNGNSFSILKNDVENLELITILSTILSKLQQVQR